MNVSIIGAGNVGGALGKSLVKVGHKIYYGVPNPDDAKHDNLKQALESAASFHKPDEAAQKSEVVIIAVPWSEAEDVVKNLALDRKIVIDCTNRINVDSKSLFESIGVDSNAELIQNWAPKAKVVKAFNHVGSSVMENPVFNDDHAIALVAGDDDEAKQTVIKLAEGIGFETLDAGKLAAARYLENWAMLWIHLGQNANLGWRFAFKLLKG